MDNFLGDTATGVPLLKNLILLWLVAGIVLSSCSPSNPEQAFSDLRIDEPYFRSLPLCERVRIYAQVGSRFMDQKHFLVLAPSWADAYIGTQPKDALAACIAEEGERQVGLLTRMPDQRAQISLVIHALSYLAGREDLKAIPAIHDFIREAVCEANVDERSLLAVLIANGHTDTSSVDWHSQLIQEVCGE